MGRQYISPPSTRAKVHNPKPSTSWINILWTRGSDQWNLTARKKRFANVVTGLSSAKILCLWRRRMYCLSLAHGRPKFVLSSVTVSTWYKSPSRLLIILTGKETTFSCVTSGSCSSRLNPIQARVYMVSRSPVLRPAPLLENGLQLVPAVCRRHDFNEHVFLWYRRFPRVVIARPDMMRGVSTWIALPGFWRRLGIKVSRSSSLKNWAISPKTHEPSLSAANRHSFCECWLHSILGWLQDSQDHRFMNYENENEKVRTHQTHQNHYHDIE